MSELSICTQTTNTLQTKWSEIRHGGFALYHLNTKPGGGSKQIIRTFQNEVALECITWHAQFLPQEQNVHILPKLVDGLWKNIRQSQSKSLQVIKALQEKLPMCASQVEQVQLQTLIDSLRASRLSEGSQTIMHDNRPIRGLIMLLQIIIERFRLLLILEDLHFCHSATPYVWLDATLKHLPIDVRFMIIISTQSESQLPQALPEAFQVLSKEHSFEDLRPLPWDQDELSTHPTSYTADALEWWTEGMPGRFLELKDHPQPQTEAIYAYKDFSFIKENEHDLICAASLFGYHFPLLLVARAANLDPETAKQIFEASTFISPQASDPNSNEEIWGFHTVTAQLKIRSYALQQEHALETLSLYEKRSGVRNKELLYRLL